MPDDLPRPLERLFHHYPQPDRLAVAASGFVITRILEDGDRQDLRWLTQTFSETVICRCFDLRGQQQLSRRSRAFWCRVLDRPLSPRPTANEALWPL